MNNDDDVESTITYTSTGSSNRRKRRRDDGSETCSPTTMEEYYSTTLQDGGYSSYEQNHHFSSSTTTTTTNHDKSPRKNQPRQPPPPPPAVNPPPPPITFDFATKTHPTTTTTTTTTTPSSPSPSHTHPRRLWVKSRSSAWWDEHNHPDYPDTSFTKSFRMSKTTFNTLCAELNPTISKQDTMLRSAIPVRQRVAVCIWRLATGEPLRLVSKRFGLGISTCHKLVLDVCSAIRTVLMPKYLQWPEDQDSSSNNNYTNSPSSSSVKTQFESISNIPNLIGAIHTTHIPIIAPKISVAAYLNPHLTDRNHNNKPSYSITVQGVVDPTGKFTDVCIGWPGSMSNSQVLEKSHMYQRACAGLMDGVYVAGGRSYPLTDWLLVPYGEENGLTWTQHAFNEKVREVEAIAKEAFKRLKGRWGCLRKRTEVKLQDLPVVVGACCVLHNVCEMSGDGVMMIGLEEEEIDKCEIFDDQMMVAQVVVGVSSVESSSSSSVKARDVIAHNLLHHGHAGTGFLL